MGVAADACIKHAQCTIVIIHVIVTHAALPQHYQHEHMKDNGQCQERQGIIFCGAAVDVKQKSASALAAVFHQAPGKGRRMIWRALEWHWHQHCSIHILAPVGVHCCYR